MEPRGPFAVIRVTHGYTAKPARDLGADGVIDGLAEAFGAIQVPTRRPVAGQSATGQKDESS